MGARVSGLDKRGWPSGRWGTAARIVAFGLLLAIIIFLAKGPPVDPEEISRVVFTGADLAHVSARFQRTWNRPPTPVELRKAFERYARDEVFYREALARGLDRNDPVVKMSLVRKITMLGTAQIQDSKPGDDEIKAYFELRTERYRVPAALYLVQVYLSWEKRGERIDADAAELLERLRQNDPPPGELAGLGDVTMLPTYADDMSETELAGTFGDMFRDAVMMLEVGRWEGPVKSEFGLHLVKVIEREESRIPDWTEVRDRIVADIQLLR
jgi:hypothetical protein